jgi:hypothetical protein
VYALKLKQFVFSNEIIEVGIAEIDDAIKALYPRTRLYLSAGTGNFVNDEIVYQGASLAAANGRAIVYSTVANQYLDVIRANGSFVSGTITGNTSGTSRTITLADDTATMNNAFEDIIDNARIEAEADGIIDFSEINPFGEP